MLTSKSKLATGWVRTGLRLSITVKAMMRAQKIRYQTYVRQRFSSFRSWFEQHQQTYQRYNHEEIVQP